MNLIHQSKSKEATCIGLRDKILGVILQGKVIPIYYYSNTNSMTECRGYS